MIKQYGISTISKELSEKERHIENLKIKGFTVLKNVLEENKLIEIRKSLDENYLHQEKEFGVDKMKSINELNMLRCPLAYDDLFIELITNKDVLDIVIDILGSEVLLHLQNGIINRENFFK